MVNMTLAALMLATLIISPRVCSAEQGEVLSAGELAIRCTNGEIKNNGKLAFPVDYALCRITFSAYRDGYMNGTYRGAMSAYIEDSMVAGGVNGIADLQRRIGPVLTASRCGIDSRGDASVTRLIDAFQVYIAEHPGLSNHHYAAVLRGAIDEKLCGRQKE